MLRMVTALVAGLTFGGLAQTQTLQLEARPAKKIKAHQSVTLRVLNPPQGIQLRWDKETGHGEFPNGNSGAEVSFTATTPGESVKIICTASGTSITGDIYLDVAPEDAPASTVQRQGAPNVNKPNPRPATPPPVVHPQEAFPSELVAITDIVSPNDGAVTPSGKMGDAESPDGPVSPLRPASFCKYDDLNCVLFEYDLGRAHLGWAGIAWQVLPPNAKLNFGEFKGRDLSATGYRSLRVWARVQSGQDRLRVEFKSGGNVAPEYAVNNPASYIVSSGIKTVGQDWQVFCIALPIRGNDPRKNDALKNVVSPFTIVISGAYNPAELIGLAIDGPSFSRQTCTSDAR